MAKKPITRKTRKQDTLNLYAKILIVCEGKTEVIYFDSLKRYWNIKGVKIESIQSDLGSSPISVVKYAKEIQEQEMYKYGEKQAYDNVFCVYDRDMHQCINEAQNFINGYNTKSDVNITEVLSDPCFEYWLLIHFIINTKPYIATGKKTIGDQCKSQLKLYLPKYEKSNIADFFDALMDNYSKAIKHAKLAYKNAQQVGSTNPSTQVHLLLDYLNNIKQSLFNEDKPSINHKIKF